MTKQTLFTGLKYLLGIGLLTWVVWVNWAPEGGQGLRDVLQKNICVTPLLLAIVLSLAGTLLTYVRWYVLVRAQGLPFTVVGAVRLGLIGNFLNTFLPGSLGGDVVKAACIARQQNRRTVAVATVLIDRVIGLCGLFWLVALLSGVFMLTGEFDQLVVSGEGATALKTIAVGAGILSGASLVFWLMLGVLPAAWAEGLAVRLARFPKVGPALCELWQAVRMYRSRGRSVGLALAMAILGHVGFVVAFYLAALTLSAAGQIPSLGTHFLLVPVGMTIKAGFPMPGGLGGSELAFPWLYGLAGCVESLGLFAALAQRVVEWSVGFIGYLVYLRMRADLRPVPEQEPARELAAAEA